MHVIVLGACDVGRGIAQYLVREGHPVVVVDEDAHALEQLNESLDVQTVQGLGARPSVLQKAGAATAEMLIAVTPSDEVNMLACQMAYSLFQVPKKIARVRDSSYLSLTGSHVYTPDNLPVDVIISPEVEVAQAIERTISVPGAFDVHTFAHGKLLLVGCKVSPRARLLGQKLKRWGQLEVPFEVLCLKRGDRLLVPTKEDRLETEDEVYILIRPDDLETGLDMLGKVEPPVRHLLIIGGGQVGYHLAQSLEEKINVRVLDSNPERAHFLAESLKNSTVLLGDALNKQILQQENIAHMDLVLCVTSNDAVNMLATLLMRDYHVPNVLTLLQKNNFTPLADSVGLDKVVSPQQITLSRILQHVRHMCVVDVHTIADSEGEVLELKVPDDSGMLGVPLRDLRLPRGAIAGAVFLQTGQILFPWEEDAIVQQNSHILVFSETKAVAAVEKLFGV